MSEYQLHPSQSMRMSLSYNTPVTVDSAEQDDVKLVAASKSGDQDAFAMLVQRHQHRVFNLVYRMLQQYDEANEVTQETFLAAWQGLPTFRGDARFSTWLYRIAYNCCLKQVEQRKRDNALHTAIEAEQRLEDADSETRADTAIDAHERQTLVREQLSTLPTKYRLVLVLRHLQEKTYEEMAEILAMPIGTIKTHLFRARNLLKERLQAFDSQRNTTSGGQ
ncbi:MAG: sigma-70 family RNA polymerase sigma factor [Ktedonobacteraceae bacterium]